MNAIDVFQEWLDDYLNFEHNPKKDIFWLDTIDYLCKRFDNPQDAAPCIHVAGSKGKGSVSRMISCILDEAGYKTGLYSSPHITDFRERISNAGKFFDEEISFYSIFNNSEIVRLKAFANFSKVRYFASTIPASILLTVDGSKPFL